MIEIEGRQYIESRYARCTCCKVPMLGIMDHKARLVCSACCDRYDLDRFGEMIERAS